LELISNIAGELDTFICRDFKITWILKMEAACSSEALLSAFRGEQYHSPEDHSLNTYCHRNL
jgi:hypothetical protein